MIKKTVLILLFMSVFYMNGCSMSSLAVDSINPNRYSNKYNHLNKLYAVKEGMSKEQVVKEWSYPYRENEDLWIYYFPDILDQKIYLTFQDSILVNMKSSPLGIK